jgi:hypothetical protein
MTAPRTFVDQRFYSSQFGRFMSADRFKQTPSANDSGSWNKYSYTRGDPVNRVDHLGTCDQTLFDLDSGDGSGGNGCDQTDNGINTSGDQATCTANNLVYDFNSNSCVEQQQGTSVNCSATPTAPGCSPPQPTCDDILTGDITSYLAGYANGVSPLSTSANIQSLVSVGLADNVDPRLVVALAVAETSAGQNMNWGAYNAWNNGHQSYSGWAAAIAGVTNNLNINYIGVGLTNTTTLYAKYEATKGKVHDRQLGVLNGALTKMGGVIPPLLTHAMRPTRDPRTNDDTTRFYPGCLSVIRVRHVQRVWDGICTQHLS